MLGRIVCWVMIAGGGWVPSVWGGSPIALGTEALSFINAGRLVPLAVSESGHSLLLPGKTLSVQLGNRLLLKTALSVQAQDVSHLHVAIQKVQQLASLSHSRWWLLTVDSEILAEVMLQLQQQKGVLAVQPDLLQLRQHAGYPEVTRPEDILLMKAMPRLQKKVRLAIIDDGFDLQSIALKNQNIVFQYDADFRVMDASPKTLADTHGDQMAAVLLQTAWQAGAKPELILIRQASSWTSDMVLAFSVARMMQADIVNSSWVLPFLPDPLLDVLTDWLQAAQPYLLFAAGNNRRDACDDNAVGSIKGVWVIGAGNAQGQPMPYSNNGSCVSFYAPAQFTVIVGAGTKNVAGTSAATAYTSGLLVQALAKGKRPSESTLQQYLNNALVNVDTIND